MLREVDPGLTSVAEIATAERHACARMVDGTVRCWGRNSEGQLGDGTTTSRAVPAPVLGLTNVAEIAAVGNRTCARLTDATVSCWGSNWQGELGDGTTTSRSVPAPVVF